MQSATHTLQSTCRILGFDLQLLFLLSIFFYAKTSHLIYCYQGKEVARTFRQHSIGRTDILWGEKYCFAPAGQDMEKEDFPTVSGCYVPVRHFRSHTRERFTRVSWNRPERFYGGLFKYVEKASGFTETRGGIFDTPF